MENFVIEYIEKGVENQFMYFYADNEEHAIEQFKDFFNSYEGSIELIHCGYVIG